MQPTTRLYYVDWLRVIAFAILIAYHSSVAFFPDMKWLISSPQGSETLSLVMMYPRAWRLALLFFVSGMGTWFVFRSSTGLDFLKERFLRLFVPLIFAMCVIVVPQVWYERMWEDGYRGSLLTFWLTRYFTEGKYPDGNFTWAHMWFVGYLIVMCFVCYPVFRLVTQPVMRPVMDWFERQARSNAIYLFFLLPLVLNLALSPFFPRQTNALYNDGAWFAAWASWFGLGFLIAKHHAAVIGAIISRRHASLALSLTIAACLYVFSWTGAGGYSIGDYNEMTPLFKVLLFALAWSTILAAVGYAAAHLNKGSRALSWLNRKIFPLYIVHQTVVVAALFYVLPLGLGVWTEYLLVAAATAAGSLLFAILADLLPSSLKPLVGLSDKPSRSAAAKPASARA
ncbi:acyltransferase [Mesorhizobium sp. YM1C-6-2]|uniref:acyltransferase family protein n=1 Tax=Mesorhizobium sp. YM1C-6-2 TaxID=1827501 RepID=UPI000EF284BD|nr:acyltransferase [Mesorhizobium sp. YM1C-6-2]RLP27650.1 acyltransferase [Mesorhizobium sp. YM1C-6-2]